MLSVTIYGNKNFALISAVRDVFMDGSSDKNCLLYLPHKCR